MKEVGKCTNCYAIIFDGNIYEEDDISYRCSLCGEIIDTDDLVDIDATFWYVSVIDENGQEDDRYYRISSDDGVPKKYIESICVAEHLEILEISEIDSDEYHEAIGTELEVFGACSCGSLDEDDDDLY